jgi:hypothetical protein
MVSPSHSAVDSLAGDQEPPPVGCTSTDPVMETNPPTGTSQSAWITPAVTKNPIPAMASQQPRTLDATIVPPLFRLFLLPLSRYRWTLLDDMLGAFCQTPFSDSI